VEAFSNAIALAEDKDLEKMARVYRGQSYNGLQQYQLALQDFDRAIRLDPKDAGTFVDRAITYAYLQQAPAARKDLRRALEMDGQGKIAQNAWYWMARLAFSEGDQEGAIDALDQLIDLAPEDAEAYFLRGTAYSNLFQWQRAIQNFDAALSHHPRYPQALTNRGVCKLNLIPLRARQGQDCLEDPCKDLLQARKMGDQAAEELIQRHCKGCQN